MRSGTWLVGCLLVACSVTPAAPSTTGPTQTNRPSATASAIATAGEPASIGSALPVELSGVELHTFAVGEDVLLRLAEELGVAISDLEVAFASDHGARFVQMYALRLRGTDTGQLAATWAAVAFPPDITEVSVSESTVADRMVTVVESAGLPSVGTYYLDPRDDILIVVQAFDVETATDALAAVP